MADVHLAVSEGPLGSGFAKLAVVKTLRPHLGDDPAFVTMLMDEARVTARLAHPNLVQLFEVGCVDDQYFLAMEFLEGQPFHRLTRRVERSQRSGTEIDRRMLFAVVSDVLAGLHHAHELADYDGTPLNIVHRDISPHNVFVTYDGIVKVVDFGLAKAAGRLAETEHGVVKGKIRYMSPEQAACRGVDRRTDIFAAGVMLWNVATGMKLWGERTDAEVADALRTGQYPTSPRELCPGVPVEIDAICQKALAFELASRYATAAEMRADVEAFLGHESVSIRKALTSTMCGLFSGDRAKLRKVVQSSSIATTPSTKMLAAQALTRSAAKPRSSRSGSSPRRERKQLEVTSERRKRRRNPGKLAPSPPAPAPARMRWRGIALAAGLVAAGLLAVTVRVAHSGASEVPASRALDTVAPELTGFASQTRPKAETAAAASTPVAPKRPHARRAASITQTAGPSEPVTTAAPAVEPARPADTATRGPRGAPIDSSDPWSTKQ